MNKKWFYIEILRKGKESIRKGEINTLKSACGLLQSGRDLSYPIQHKSRKAYITRREMVT